MELGLLDSRWGFRNHHGHELARGNPSEYLRHNLSITSSGKPPVPAKFPKCITRPYTDVLLPPANNDWEVELVAVIGAA